MSIENNSGLKPGTLLRHDTYRIERILGQGGFGITYLATDLSLERYVAIKEFFPKDYCDREEATSHLTIGTSSNIELVSRLKSKFLKEARNIAKFDHPGIIKIHTAFEENNTAYYVMDYIEGNNLNEIVKKSGALGEAVAINYIKQVGEALEYLHKHNVNHLDIKPANIMIRKSDVRPILIDFGLSKQYENNEEVTSTLIHAVSNGYSPLELYTPGQISIFSPQVDVYSLGATLYYLLSGKTPPSPINLEMQGIPKLTNCSSQVNEIFLKSITNKIDDRYSTIEKLNAVLTNINNNNKKVVGGIYISNDNELYTKINNKKLDLNISIFKSFKINRIFACYKFMLIFNLFFISLILFPDFPKLIPIINNGIFKIINYITIFNLNEDVSFSIINIICDEILFLCSLINRYGFFLLFVWIENVSFSFVLYNHGKKSLQNLDKQGFVPIKVSIFLSILNLILNLIIVFKFFKSLYNDESDIFNYIICSQLLSVLICVFISLKALLSINNIENNIIFRNETDIDKCFQYGIWIFIILGLNSYIAINAGISWAYIIFIPFVIMFLLSGFLAKHKDLAIKFQHKVDLLIHKFKKKSK